MYRIESTTTKIKVNYNIGFFPFELYPMQKNQIDKDVRFDVISIVHNSSKTNIEHFEGAFTP